MAAEFVSLADWLTGAAPDAVANEPIAEPVESPEDSACDREPERAVEADLASALRDARLFAARLADAFDAAVARLLRELASDVLARELRLAPCDLGALVRRVAERAPVLRVRVAPADLARIADVPALADGALSAGDAIVELAGGALDARLGVRLAAVLEALA